MNASKIIKAYIGAGTYSTTEPMTQGDYGEAWEENDCLVGAVYGIKFESASVDKDAELIDIRVSADGTTYTTAGAAVRALEDKVDNQSVTISGTGLFIGGVVVEEEAQGQETSN